MQSMPDVSPPKWHLAHTTWFFEAFVLQPYARAYRAYDPKFNYLFNSYYETAGSLYPRAKRGLLSRPTVEEVCAYRHSIDEGIRALLLTSTDAQLKQVDFRITLGLHHEQQHQELLLTDIKHIFSQNPVRPSYLSLRSLDAIEDTPPQTWVELEGGLHSIGYAGTGFAYDNETPRHRIYLEDYALAGRLVTNAEYLEFMNAGGYEQPEHWLSDGWSTVKEHQWRAPLYWEKIDDRWWHMTLAGMQPVIPGAPVCHVSFYEADAYARWAGCRLPSEQEWEVAASQLDVQGNLRETGDLQPRPSRLNEGLSQIYGDVWEWTRSHYSPYPGFRPLTGTLGEYNGKFMCNQVVLRGGSCVTPTSHIRATYRNFFYPRDRWQFSGIRLAMDQ